MKTSQLLLCACLFLLLSSRPLFAQTQIEISAAELATHAPPPFAYIKAPGSDDANVQFYLTTALAVAAGFEEETAISIGLNNQLLDDQRNTSGTPFLNFKARRQYHFTSAKQRKKLWQQFLGTRDIRQLSIYLHALQDFYYHQGYGWFCGHLLAGHKPDQSWQPRNLTKNSEMAHATFVKLSEAARLLNQSHRKIELANFADAVTVFLQAPTPQTQSVTYRLLCERIAENHLVAASFLSKIQQVFFAYENNVEVRAQLVQGIRHKDEPSLQTLHVGQD